MSILTGFGLDLARQCYVPGALVPHSVSRQITSNLIDRLNITLDAQSLTPARDPCPSHRAGDYEPTLCPKATHTLGLAPRIKHTPPF